MKSFKEFIAEDIFKSGRSTSKFGSGISDFRFFINPTKKELTEIDYNARGFIDMKGNLYLLKASSTFLHGDLLELLSAVLPVKAREFHLNTIKETGGLAIERRTDAIWISESIRSTMRTNPKYEEKMKKEITSIFRKAKKKNSSFKFYEKVR